MAAMLVFGAHGQLGRALAAGAERQGVATRLIGRTEADIADAGAVARAFAAEAPALVVNAAAYTKVDSAENEAEAAFRANAKGPEVLAAACAAAHVPLVHVSTDYVFDGMKRGAYTEDDPIAPLGVYGHSKAEGEAAVRRRLEHHVILRTSWIYGVYGSNFLKTVLRLARECDELRIVANQRGCPTGSADIADAIMVIAPLIARGAPVWGTYHFAGPEAVTWHEFACEIVDAQAAFTNRRPPVHPVSSAEYPTLARRPLNSALDSSHFAATFGVTAMNWRERTRQVTAALLRTQASEEA